MNRTEETEKTEHTVGYAFTIQQQTGQQQTVNVTGNFPVGVEKKAAFQELNKMTRVLEALLRRNNLQVMYFNRSDLENQLIDLRKEAPSKKPGGLGDLNKRIDMVENQLGRVNVGIEEIEKELLEEWGL